MNCWSPWPGRSTHRPVHEDRSTRVPTRQFILHADKPRRHGSNEVLSHLPGETVGNASPWPEWTHPEQALRDAGRWLRRYHDVVRDFRPPPESVWRLASRAWQPGDVIAHNDAAPYNAVWVSDGTGPGRLRGFIDWDFAAPQSPTWDLAYVVFSWVPLHARHVVTREGFTDFEARGNRLRMLLDAYGWTGTADEILDAVVARVEAHSEDVLLLAATDPLFARLMRDGVIRDLNTALAELNNDRSALIAER